MSEVYKLNCGSSNKCYRGRLPENSDIRLKVHNRLANLSKYWSRQNLNWFVRCSVLIQLVKLGDGCDGAC